MTWTLREIDERDIVERYGLTSMAAKLLSAANLNEEQTKELLDGSCELTTSLAECVTACSERLMKAKQNKEKVFIAGDYDADGICATTILKKTLDILHIRNGFYIPDRFKEGYGLHAHTVEQAAEKGYSLFITVDNGVKAHDAIDKVHELGLEIIVTDHHIIEEEVKADLVVHPDYMEDRFKTLSGAGVALEISRTLIGDDDEMTALACVAAVGDAMPLWKETRAIVKAGLQILNQGKPRTLYSLLDTTDHIDEVTLGFQLIPKLNAVSRMNDISNVNNVVRFLAASSLVNVADFAEQMKLVNDARKKLSASMCRKAEQRVGEGDFILIYDESFSPGICGLAAGKIAAKYHRPTLILGENDGKITGSGRSVPGFDLFDFFKDFENLQAFGGHTMAVGMSLAKEDYKQFEEEVYRRLEGKTFEFGEDERSAILIDEDDMNMENIMGLDVLAPLPKELGEALFAIQNPTQSELKRGTKVSRYRFVNKTGGYEAVAFAVKDLPVKDNPACVIGRVGLNRYRDLITCQLTLEDVQ